MRPQSSIIRHPVRSPAHHGQRVVPRNGQSVSALGHSGIIPEPVLRPRELLLCAEYDGCVIEEGIPFFYLTDPDEFE